MPVQIPIGAVIPWYNLNGTNAGTDPTPPYGWELCDGGTVATVGSPIYGKTKPPLMKTVANGGTARMPRGRDTSAGAYGGTNSWGTGGADSNSHTHSVSVSVGGSTNSNSGHSHTYENPATGAESSGHNHWVNVAIDRDDSGYGGTRFVYATVSGQHDHGTTGGNSNNHSHTVNSHNHGSESSHWHGVSASGSATSGGPSSGDLRPAYVDLAWIIRVL